ncbi:hypothetical protein G6F45_014127 [Rhizopus arrhizus]|nr:hypothetical protein G6F45_014127 [Rhizopus arrhizus]
MHRGACVEVISSREDRAAFLQQDYAQLFENPDWLKTQLQRLLGLHSRDVINGWLMTTSACMCRRRRTPRPASS